ncbi:hypothetical protein [Leptospira mayottensis]|uniref:hypothetical protein n=1 Tax=Leptospira mayottensis TaxID=1137606 RepID=UPI0019D41102|nr:hypothetical protein [Leptospira mayottensis]
MIIEFVVSIRREVATVVIWHRQQNCLQLYLDFEGIDLLHESFRCGFDALHGEILW